MNFHLFMGHDYYPCAGLGDYIGSFPELTDALEAGLQVDGKDWIIVLESYESGLRVVYEKWRG